MDLLLIICKKYFDLLRRDLFFDQITQLILKNIDLKAAPSSSSSSIGSLQDTQLVDQLKLKNLKLFEEFARCLATTELRAMNGIDLNLPITRDVVENMEIFKKLNVHLDAAVEKAGISKGDLNCVEMIGGASRIPLISKIVKDHFDGIEVGSHINGD